MDEKYLYMRYMTEVPESFRNLCYMNFDLECKKIISKMLLKREHFGNDFLFLDESYKFLGFFDNMNCLVQGKDGYYECTLAFVQNCFGLKYRRFDVQRTQLEYKNHDLMIHRKKIRKMIHG